MDIGRISGQTNILAQAGDLSTLRFRKGQAAFDLGNGIVELNRFNYGRGKWSTQVTTSGVEFGSLPIGKGSAPTIAQGLVDGVFEVTGTNDVGDLHQVDVTGKARLIPLVGS